MGLIHLYCGDGKGKTTAAVGAAIRMAGSGKKVLFFQFLKDNVSSERKILSEIKNITVLAGYEGLGKVWTFDENQIKELSVWYEARFSEIKKLSKEYDMLVLDEAIAAVNYGYLSKNTLLDFLKNKLPRLEIILTGMNPDAEFIEIADYVSKVTKIKHPFDRGIGARDGIEV